MFRIRERIRSGKRAFVAGGSARGSYHLPAIRLRRCSALRSIASNEKDAECADDFDEEENILSRPYPVHGLEERAWWSRGYVYARRALVKSADAEAEPSEQESGLRARWEATQAEYREKYDPCVDEGAEGNTLTIVTLRVPERVARSFREPGQAIQV